MQRYPTLRPDLYARLVNQMIADAHARHMIVNVRAEAYSISEKCGIAAGIVERDITEAAVAARVPLEFGGPILPAGV